MINLNNLKKGATVKLRCGGEAVVSKIYKTSSPNAFNLVFNNGNSTLTWYNDGIKQLNMDWLDIIEIIPAPFDWDNVKAGMAFISSHQASVGDVLIFDCHSNFKNNLDGGDCVIVAENNFWDSTERTVYSKEFLKRAPEYDIEVKS